MAVSRRSIREIAALGAVSFIGVVLLVMYNEAVFGAYTLSGGYGGGFAEQAANVSPFLFLERLALSFVHLRVGMLWTSPFLLISLFALVKHRREAPDWALGASLGGLLYLVIQYRANRVTGGTGFFSYRYPLEALMAAGPAMAIGTWHWLQGSERKRLWFGALVALAVAAHAVGSLSPTNV